MTKILITNDDGINYGYNLATDIQYSATAGAAFEAAFQKIHTIAFSEEACANHEVTDQYLEEIIAELLEKPLEQSDMECEFSGMRTDGVQEDSSGSQCVNGCLLCGSLY